MMKHRNDLFLSAVAALVLNLLVPGALFSQTDNFPATRASLTINLPGAGDLSIDLTGPTQVTRSDIGDNDQNGLEEVQLVVDSMDLQGNHAVLGPVQLTLNPQSGPSTGFAEESVNQIPNQLEPPLDSRLDMFVRIALPDSALVTREPITLRATLSEIPPAVGEAYEFDGQVQLIDANNGQLVGFVTKVVHIVRPGVVEHDIFPETTASLLVELPATATPGLRTPVPTLPPIGSVYLSPDGARIQFQGPNFDISLERVRHRPLTFPPPVITTIGPDERASFQTSMQGKATVNGQEFDLSLTGPVEVVTLGKADQTTGNWQTEMLSMSLSGDIPGVPPIVIRESPRLPSPGQTTVSDLGDGLFQIDSFFDVFTEISIDGGQTWAPADGPLPVAASRTGAHASSSDLPPDSGVYHAAPEVVAVFPVPALPIVLEDLRHYPLDVLSRRIVGVNEITTFESSLTATAVIGGQQRTSVELKGQVETIVFGKAGQTTGGFDTEIVSMSLTGEIGGRPVIIQESPQLPSTGTTEIVALGGGQFHIDSFFDVFTELSVDGGPSVAAAGPVRVDLEEPTRVNIPLTGPTQVDVFFEGPNEGDAIDDDGNGLDEVATEIVSLSLTGDTPLGPIGVGLRQDQPSLGGIEEQANNTPGRLDLDPFHPGDADSFFDVFFEIDLNGQTLVPATGVTQLTAVIRDKPPSSGESYVFEPPAPVELIDLATGRGTGIYIVREVHTPSPFIEVDVLEQTVANLTLVGGPIGPNPQGFVLSGPSTVHVFFEGGEGDASDDDGDNLDEVRTELVQLDLSGGGLNLSLNPAQPSFGEIEELINNTPGRLDLDPFHPGDADSFFDVFFQVDVGGGVLLHNAEPLRLQSVIREKPPQRATYVHILPPTGPIELLDQNNNPTGVFLIDANHSVGGVVEIDEFDFTLGEIELIAPDGATEVVNVDGPATVHVFFEGAVEGDAGDDDGNGLDEVETEMVSLSMTGNSSLGPVEVRLNPAIPSTGQIEEQVNNNPVRLDLDPFHPGDADSFFDVFFEIEITTPTGPLVFHTEAPKRMSAVIADKPPGPGTLYEGLQNIPLFDENGNPTGFSIGAGRHRPNPPVEIDVFDFTLGEIELIAPDGTTEVVNVDGPATVHVFFEGTAEGDAVDGDGDGRDEVHTRMVDLSLSGNSPVFGPVQVGLYPPIPSTGEIEELINNTPGLLDLDPFAPGDADSFFDVFFEIQIGGQVFHTELPKRMSAVITEKPPGPGNVYEGLERIPLLDEFGNDTGFAIGAGRHTPQPPRRPFRITEIAFDGASATLTWHSRPGESYTLESSPDLRGWNPLAVGIASQGLLTTHTDPAVPPSARRQFYRVVEE